MSTPTNRKRAFDLAIELAKTLRLEAGAVTYNASRFIPIILRSLNAGVGDAAAQLDAEQKAHAETRAALDKANRALQIILENAGTPSLVRRLAVQGQQSLAAPSAPAKETK